MADGPAVHTEPRPGRQLRGAQGLDSGDNALQGEAVTSVTCWRKEKPPLFSEAAPKRDRTNGQLEDGATRPGNRQAGQPLPLGEDPQVSRHGRRHVRFRLSFDRKTGDCLLNLHVPHFQAKDCFKKLGSPR